MKMINRKSFNTSDEATKVITEMNSSVVSSKSLYVVLVQRVQSRFIRHSYPKEN